jgi:hypothetical protein
MQENSFDSNYDKLLLNWKHYIQTNLFPIVKSLNVDIEGNFFGENKSFNECSEMEDKQSNLYKILNDLQPKRVLEIGFNAGFSTLLMKMQNPNIEMVCLDIVQHKYVIPCFDKINKDFGNMTLIKGSSYDIGLPQLIKSNEKFDLIHIDGDHRVAGAYKDFSMCLKLCHNDTVIIFDDTDVVHLNNLCNDFIKKGLVFEYKFEGYKNNQYYKHRFFKKTPSRI